MPSAIAEPEEIHIGLDVPKATARQIYLWARRQDWPEDTQLEPPGEYHVTLLFSTAGRELKDEWWLEHMDTAEVSTAAVRAFPSGEKGGFAYVLLLEAPEVLEKATEMQERGKAFGMPIRDFDGGYKPHITVAYGPAPRLNIKPPNFTFDVGPSSVSPMRPKESSAPPEPPNYRKQDKPSEHCGNCKMQFEGRCWGFANKEVQPDAVCNEWAPEEKRSAYNPDEVKILDHLSLTNVAANLHYKFQEGGLDDGGANEYAKRILQLIGYPPDDITVKAALDAWQKLYPGDKLLNPAPPTVPTESWGYGTTSHRKVAGETPNQEYRRWQQLNQAFSEKHQPQSMTVHEFPDGYAVRQHANELDVNRVGQFMRNCWQGKQHLDEARDNGYSYASLHDPQGMPRVAWYEHTNPHHANAETVIKQPLGMRNTELGQFPNSQYVPYLRQYADTKGYQFIAPEAPTMPDFAGTIGEGQAIGRVSEKFAPTHRDLSYSFSKSADLHDEVLPSWENKGFTVLHEETPEQVHLHTVELPPDTRGQGYGHRFMDNIKHYVDENGKPLVVDPVFNPQFFDKFDWLNPTGERRYEYQPQRIEAKKGSAPDLRYLHASDNEYEPGTQLLPPAQTGHSSDFTNTPWYDPNYVYLRDHRADPVAFENYGANIYLVEPEGKVEQDPEHDPKRYEYPEDDPAYYSWRAPSARIIRKLTDQDLDDFYSGRGLWKHGGDITHCLNCGHPLEDSLDTCPECSSTVPSQVNNPEDHIPEFGQRPPDQKRDIQFSNDWNYR